MSAFDDRRRSAPGAVPVNAPYVPPLQRRSESAQAESQRPPPEPEWPPLTPDLARSPFTAQRQAAAPTLTAAALSHEDRQAVQQSAEQLAVQRQSVQRVGDELAQRGLRPESLERLSRRTPEGEPKVPVVPREERLDREDACVQDALALLRRDARYLPLHTRAELAGDAIERGRAQGLDVDAVRLAVLAGVTDGMQREVLQTMFQRSEQGIQQRAQQRDDHAVQLQHAQLQRVAKTAEQAHDLLNQQTALDRIQGRRGGGQPLPDDVRKQLELGLNHDLSQVRVHTDTEADLLARSLQAVAFTSGKDIYFQSGEYNPSSKLDLIAHEAAHVKQQDLGQVGPGVDPDAALEHQAQQFGAGVQAAPAVTGPASATTGQTVQRLKAPTPAPEFWNTVQWTRQFSGTLGRAHITLSLTVNDEQVQGTYSYAGHIGQLRLRGTFNPDAVVLTLSEQDPQHPGATAAQLQLTPGGASQLTGTWTGNGKALPITLSLADAPKLPETPQNTKQPPQPTPQDAQPPAPQPPMPQPKGLVLLLPSGTTGLTVRSDQLNMLSNLQDAGKIVWVVHAPEPDAQPQRMNISDRGLKQLEQFEGAGPNPYKDSSGYMTIGYGHLLDTNRNGRVDEIEWENYDKLGFPRKNMTQKQQEELSKVDLVSRVAAVNNMLKKPVTQDIFDALVSLSFNTGVGKGGLLTSDVMISVNAGEFDKLPAEFYRWIHSRGRIVKGLKNRRLKEMLNFSTPYVKGERQ